MTKFNLVKVDWFENRLLVKDRIDAIGLKSSDPNLFTTIDKACSNEWAFLFLAPDGFLVLRPRYRKEKSFIEMTVAHSDGLDSLKNHQQQIFELARMGGAEFIEFLSVRKGFNRVAPSLGWSKFGYHRNLAIWQYKL